MYFLLYLIAISSTFATPQNTPKQKPSPTLKVLAQASKHKTSPQKVLSTLEQTKKQDYLTCGINTGLAGFAYSDQKGNWTGFDVDFCRASAAALFNDPTRVKFVPLTSKTRFTALTTGEIDLLYRNSTWTYTRDTSLGISFAGVNYYDGQGFLVHNSSHVNSVKELDGATICVTPGTTTELNLADYFRKHSLKYSPLIVETVQQGIKAYEAKRCDAFTADYSALHSIRSTLSSADEHTILAEIISKEPLGPAVRKNDDQWFKINSWILIALKNAEELGITSKNIEGLLKSNNPKIERFIGTINLPATTQLGLSKHWAFNMIKMVGNYGEIYDRNLGPNTPLNIQRGLNKLWTEGGLIYGPPIR
ncbi:MAG TPA: amino acid ABC transporter substrate-binding protein [Gammaproteobacteria bacterium]|nr:amino acid ABC transporter substrate-binding protein [Gammaproteobacteria bacterium]